jgi:hypothetical protein
MKDHGLMQTIARVNRVFRDKPGGLIVDYIGLAEDLKKAMATYTESKGKGEVCIDQHAALKVLEREIEVCRDLLHGIDCSPSSTSHPRSGSSSSHPSSNISSTRMTERTAGSLRWTRSPNPSPSPYPSMEHSH